MEGLNSKETHENNQIGAEDISVTAQNALGESIKLFNLKYATPEELV